VLKAEIWTRLGDEDVRREMNSILADCGEALRGAGFPARAPRFPYSMHHGFYRSRLRTGGRKRTHADVAELLALWADGRKDPCDYARQAVCGAVKAMLSGDAGLAGRIPAVVRAAMAAVGDGYDFRRFGASRSKNADPHEAARSSGERVLDDERILDELGAGQSAQNSEVQA
jgi:hypothetical protein